jgi:hypothetical protein
VGTQVSMDEVVFQTMPTHFLTYADKTLNIEQTKELAEGYKELILILEIHYLLMIKIHSCK